PGTIIVRYEPPAGYSPAGLRYMQRMHYDMRSFSADLLSLAVGHVLLIERDKGRLQETWTLRKREAAPTAPLTPEQSALLDALFDGGRTSLELHNKNAATIQKARAAHGKALQQRFKPRMFRTHGGSIAVAFGIAALFSLAAFVVGAAAGPIVLLVIPVVLAMLGVA